MTPAELMAKDKNKKGLKAKRSVSNPVNCKLKEMRSKLNLTLRDVTVGIPGLNTSTLFRAELGANVTISTALKLAAFFGCKVEDIWSL